MKEMIDRIKQKFNAKDINQQKATLVFFTVEKKDLEGCVLYMKEFEGYGNLTMITAIDWIEKNQFQLTYHLHNYTNRTDVSIRTYIEREKPSMVSIHNLWAGARVFQREIKELFGIDFPGCPRVNDNFVLEGWDNIPPMRRDFDTKKYSEETYFPRPGRYKKDNVQFMEENLYPVEAEVKKSIADTVKKK
ncbi:MAG: NADH-quinone oxidoreductase subunit C [Candidatus Delongbacteria bacterium]|nr:NADH-quinone oxidoreductase subunit C [Candidatus Delongbacteria bacterium]MCG2761435.1 NADH-quinone oxidoreductase subunit C [Candidatus Delongbacteria bacterium]